MNLHRFFFIQALLLLSVTHILAQQEEDNTAKVPVQMAIPPSAKLNLYGLDLSTFHIFSHYI